MKRLSFCILLASLIASLSAQTDAKLLEVVNLHVVTPGSYKPFGAIENVGSQTIFDIDISWQFNNGPVSTANLTTFEIYTGGYVSAGAKEAFEHPAAVNITNTGKFPMKVWIERVNGITDANPANDTLTFEVQVVDYLPVKHVLVHYFTHTTCTPCYDGGNDFKSILSDYPQVHGVAVHNAGSDPYTIDAGTTLDTAYVIGHPTILFDLYRFPWFQQHEPAPSYTWGQPGRPVPDREMIRSPVEIRILNKTWNSSTREIAFDAEFIFHADYSGDLKINTYVTEDSVFGYQAGAPNPQSYYHPHMLRSAMGGAWGIGGVIPANVADGAVYSYHFSDTLDAGWDENLCELIVMVQEGGNDNESRAVINSGSVGVTEIMTDADAEQEKGAIRIGRDGDHLRVFAEGWNGGMRYRIYDLAGKIAGEGMVNADGTISIEALPRGIYALELDVNGSPFCSKFLR